MTTLPRSQKVIHEDKEYISQSLVRPLPMVIEKARGTRVWDLDGNKYLDFLAGAAAVNIGHNNEAVLQKAKEHMDRVLHPAMLYLYYKPAIQLAKKLIELTPGDFPKRVFFGTSGSGAVDATLKMIRHYTKRFKVIAFSGSYHGMTYGALSLSSFTSNIKKGFGPMVPGIYRLPFPDKFRPHFGNPDVEVDGIIRMLEELFKEQAPPEEVAACFIEPMQGDKGTIVPPQNFYTKLKEILQKYNIPLVADEIQTGFGRTGKWFAMEHFGIEPDVTILGKAMSSGLPLSAVVARKEIMNWSPGTHVITGGGSSAPVGAALATIEEIEDNDLVEKSRELGKFFQHKLSTLKDKHEIVGDVRGKGLMIGIDIVKNRKTKEPAKKKARKISLRSWEQGLLMMPIGDSVLRIVPSLIINKEELKEAFTIIDNSIQEVEEGKVPDEKLEGLSFW